MSHVLLKRCTGCREYTLSDVCPRCGKAAKPNRPAKFSPEDNYGEYRRKLKKLDASEKAAAAPGDRRSTDATDGVARSSAGSAKSADDAAKPAGVSKTAPKRA